VWKNSSFLPERPLARAWLVQYQLSQPGSGDFAYLNCCSSYGDVLLRASAGRHVHMRHVEREKYRHESMSSFTGASAYFYGQREALRGIRDRHI
jgi:hypothetical protein